MPPEEIWSPFIAGVKILFIYLRLCAGVVFPIKPGSDSRRKSLAFSVKDSSVELCNRPSITRHGWICPLGRCFEGSGCCLEAPSLWDVHLKPGSFHREAATRSWRPNRAQPFQTCLISGMLVNVIHKPYVSVFHFYHDMCCLYYFNNILTWIAVTALVINTAVSLLLSVWVINI